MRWRPPKGIQMGETWVAVVQTDQATLQDIFADDPDERLYGGWDVDTKTIYLLQSLPPRVKNRKYWHEVAHALVDVLWDPPE